VSVNADDSEVDSVVSILQRHNVVNLDERASQWGKEGWGGYKNYHAVSTSQQSHGQTATTRTNTASTNRKQTSDQSIPVVEEQLRVGKQVVNRGGIRIHSRVTERPVEEQVNLRQEHVHVERRPVDRPVTAADRTNAFQERTIEATEQAEQAVVGKEARVVEEVSLNKSVDSRTETVRDTVKRTDVDVERMGSDEQYRPAYEFADELSRDEKYRGRAWTQVESDARRSFEQRHPNSKWDQVKDVIRSRYDRSARST